MFKIFYRKCTDVFKIYYVTHKWHKIINKFKVIRRILIFISYHYYYLSLHICKYLIILKTIKTYLDITKFIQAEIYFSTFTKGVVLV